ncbi:MAG: hypothetical protein A2Y12_09935 [Planctomycetes bacterium GWF2_42_9]|nr:MAG: hypothetical protein A2Y12_09935 [Planctomycetes bacterium GWF2_42_9]
MANTTSETLSREIDDLRKDIGRLQKDLYSKMESAGATGKEKIALYKEKVMDALDSLKEQVSQKACGAYENIKSQSTQTLDKGRQTIGQKPVTSVLVAFCAGAMLGMISHKIRS